MIRNYFNKLDYAIGAEYYLTNEKVNREFTMNSNNFYVDEIVNLSDLGFNQRSGNYIVFKLLKKNIDTYTALIDISRRIKIPFENILFLGLKDKYATTSQYIFIKKELVDPSELINIEHSSYKLLFQGYVNRKPRKTNLIGNKFKVIIENLDDRNTCVLKNILMKIDQYGLPSYYGYQRFGVKRFNSHILGKYLVLNRIDLFLHELLYSIYPCEDTESILKRIENEFDSFIIERIVYRTSSLSKAVEKVNKQLRNLLIDAYGSYLYNLLLNNIIDKHGWSSLDKDYPTIGCIDYFEEYYRNIVLVESIPENSIYLFKCWFRHGLFKPREIFLSRINNNSVLIEFKLERGFYASIVLRELFKDNLIFC
ncbi:MAG: tRNA pseudouridine(13) synthase TruD [Desulfurococcaceae archaeon]